MPQQFYDTLLTVDKFEFANIVRIISDYENLIAELEDKLNKDNLAFIIDGIGVDSDSEVYINYTKFDLNNYHETSGFSGYIKVRDDD